MSCCNCPNQCVGFENIPSDHGLMITLNIPHNNDVVDDNVSFSTVDVNNLAEDDGNSITNNNTTAANSGKNGKECTCLKLHPQLDANLSQFHPNIYIPESLLDYPDRLVKYGGGGSGVTVFGGYHPLLGSLVMKHGGHKDLIELVSLAKIERELGTRARWKIDCIKNNNGCNSKEDGDDDGGDDDNRMSHTDHATDHPQLFNYNNKKKKKATKRKTYTAQQQPKRTSFMNTTTTKNIADGLHTITAKSQPLLGTMGSVVKRMSTINFTTTSMDNLIHKSHSINENKLPIDGSLTSSMPSPLNAFDELANEQNQIDKIEYAMNDMKRRIPSFRMIYISPMHVRERKEELKNNSFLTPGGGGGCSMRRSFSTNLLLGSSKKKLGNNSDNSKDISLVRLGSELKNDNVAKDLFDAASSFSNEKEKKVEEQSSMPPDESNPTNSEAEGISRKGSKVIRSASSVMRKGRTLHLFGSPNTKASSIHVEEDHVDICFGGSYNRYKDANDDEDTTLSEQETSQQPVSENLQQQHSCRSRADGSDGYATLMAFVDHLHEQQAYNEWKITLAQQTIGENCTKDGFSQTAPTASSLLAKGQLHGELLHHLIDSEIQVIRNLQLLTMPEEVNVVDQVRAEYEEIMSYQKTKGCKFSAAQVSSMTNAFVGKAIHKNFDPVHGRFIMLQRFGIDLRKEFIHLKPKEVVPAKHLENLFYKAWEVGGVDVEGCAKNEGRRENDGRTLLEETFHMQYQEGNGSRSNPDHNHPIFAAGLDQWQSLLALSLSMKHVNATNRIWTCGLTDGGLHNMFLSEDQQWLFDLGEPNLEPIPAFLTKFLMSFFHTLGMEEDENGEWIVRFEQEDESGRLRLTQQTLNILPKVMEAFTIAMDRIINEIFDGEEEIRILLLRYVITQLVSDCAFCVEKWRIKGGGDENRSEHQYHLEKWLWRALWDVYAGEEIRRRYLTARILLRRQPETRDLHCDAPGRTMNML